MTENKKEKRNKRGRPFKYGEPTKRKMVRLPVSVWEHAKKIAAAEGVAVSVKIVEAIKIIEKKKQKNKLRLTYNIIKYILL